MSETVPRTEITHREAKRWSQSPVGYEKESIFIEWVKSERKGDGEGKEEEWEVEGREAGGGERTAKSEYHA